MSNEREAYHKYLTNRPAYLFTGFEAFQAGAAYQREQDKGLVDALEQIADTDPDDGTAWFHDVANKALATYRAAQEGK